MSLRDALRRALRDAASRGGLNIAVSANVDATGRRTSVYSDDVVTIIDRDGEQEVIRHDPSD